MPTDTKTKKRIINLLQKGIGLPQIIKITGASQREVVAVDRHLNELKKLPMEA